MTPATIEALKVLVEADRRYRSKINAGEIAHNDDRGIEVSAVFGINPRTARVLEEAGLVETVAISEYRSLVFLGKYQPFDDL
jgi:hypothetical protein